MSVHSTIYNSLFRKTSTFTLLICASAFFFERTFDIGAETFFKTYNQGKLFEDMKKDE